MTKGGEEVGVHVTTRDKLNKILKAISASTEAFELKIDTVAIDPGLLRDDHHKLTERVTHSRCMLKTLKPTVIELQQQKQDHTEQVCFLKGTMKDGVG